MINPNKLVSSLNNALECEELDLYSICLLYQKLKPSSDITINDVLKPFVNANKEAFKEYITKEFSNLVLEELTKYEHNLKERLKVVREDIIKIEAKDFLK
jgi:hypothetical protein